jgi:integrase
MSKSNIRTTIRSNLKIFRREREGRGQYWVARGTVPIREPSGAIAFKRVELGLAGDTATARKKEIDTLNAAYERAATADHGDGITFARAFENYITSTGIVPFRWDPILKFFADKRCIDITDSDMTELRQDLFEDDAAASYINRHLHTPVIAILKMALKQRAPQLTRPKGHKNRAEGTEIVIPPSDWYGKVAPHMRPETRALMYFLAAHGRRLGDGLGCRPDHLDPKVGTLAVDQTKNGEPVTVDLHPNVLSHFLAMPDWRTRQWLFRDGPESGSNVRKDVLIACMKAGGVDIKVLELEGGYDTARTLCEAAGVPYYAPHEFGRHAFATRMLRAGYSLQYVKDAGGWKSIEVVSRLYGHLEKKEWTAGVHQVADGFVPFDCGDKMGTLPQAIPTTQ